MMQDETLELQRLRRAVAEGLPRLAFLCPDCGAKHVDGPRHDDPKVDGATRPHHEHFCPHCGMIWEGGWTFGVPCERENEIVHRLRREGVERTIVEVYRVFSTLRDIGPEGQFVMQQVVGALALFRGSLPTPQRDYTRRTLGWLVRPNGLVVADGNACTTIESTYVEGHDGQPPSVRAELTGPTLADSGGDSVRELSRPVAPEEGRVRAHREAVWQLARALGWERVDADARKLLVSVALFMSRD